MVDRRRRNHRERRPFGTRDSRSTRARLQRARSPAERHRRPTLAPGTGVARAREAHQAPEIKREFPRAAATASHGKRVS